LKTSHLFPLAICALALFGGTSFAQTSKCKTISSAELESFSVAELKREYCFNAKVAKAARTEQKANSDAFVRFSKSNNEAVLNGVFTKAEYTANFNKAKVYDQAAERSKAQADACEEQNQPITRAFTRKKAVPSCD
jgi:hypothetical protein